MRKGVKGWAKFVLFFRKQPFEKVGPNRSLF